MTTSPDSVTYPTHPYGVGGPGIALNDTALVATGSTQATALPITSPTNIFTTVAANTGCILPRRGNAEIWVTNQGANTLNVYPPWGGQTGSLGTNNAATVAPGVSARLTSSEDGTQWTAA